MDQQEEWQVSLGGHMTKALFGRGVPSMLRHRSSDKSSSDQGLWPVLLHPQSFGLIAVSTAMFSSWLALLLLSVLSLETQAFNSKLAKCFEDPRYEELLQLARNGLGQTAERKQVVVIGAGMAGLTAAKILQDAGHKVRDGAGRISCGKIRF